jgi:hypothetical protein
VRRASLPIEETEVEFDRFAGVLAVADDAGVGLEMRAIVAAAFELGLAPRPYAASVMSAPP